MDFAEAQAILDDREAVPLVIANDVGSIEEPAVPEAADGALRLVGEEDPAAEFGLMEALSDDSFGVFAFGWFELKRVGDEAKTLVESEDESSVSSVISDDKDREYRHEHARANGTEQDDWQTKFEGAPHLPIVAVGAACPVVVGVERIAHVRICVWALGVGNHRQRGEESLGVPDTPVAVNDSPMSVSDLKLLEFGPGDHAVLGDDVGELFEDQLPKMTYAEEVA